jgi:GNAT superfamily N-acetyltransferase
MKALTDQGIRPFAETDDDFRALAQVQATVYPEYPFSAEEIRHEDGTWDHEKFFRRRWILEAGGGMVGWGQVNHARSSFVPTTYWLDIGVRPDARGRGHGTALYEVALSALRERGAARIRSSAKETMADGIAFLEHRGFIETKRDWESRLFLKDFDAAPFAGARARVEAQGIRISTLKDEMGRDADATRKAFDLHDAVHNDVPSMDAPTPLDLETWKKRTLEGPNALLDAYFIAIDADGRYLGLSELERSPDDPTFLWQGLTGTRREARGRGIALALKLETVRFARERSVDHIKTWNDQNNRSMLKINEALGFVKQPAWIQFAKDL